MDNKNQTPWDQMVRAKKNMLYLGIFSIIMIFAGLTSAYVVSMHGGFWAVFKLPTQFYTSTAVIVLSSLTLVLANWYAKKENLKFTRIAVVGSVILAIGFSVLQYQGWKDMTERGALGFGYHPILNIKGQYGYTFKVFKNGKEITFNEDHLELEGAALTDSENSELKEFATSIFESEKPYQFDHVKDYGTTYAMTYKDNLMTFADGTFRYDSVELTKADVQTLKEFSKNIIDERYSDFYLKGNYGEDFTILFQGEPLEYKDGLFTKDGKVLSEALESDLLSAENTTASFIYIFSALHLAHLLFGWVYLIRLSTSTLSKGLTKETKLKLKLGTTFWHFLGGLWIYLFLFLLLIH